MEFLVPDFLEAAQTIQKINLIIQMITLFTLGFVISLWVNSKRKQQRDYRLINKQLDRILRAEQQREGVLKGQTNAQSSQIITDEIVAGTITTTKAS